ncbi:hypothetical protein [Gorillibacterium sp. sgz5001074]|uniref:hypothetical protein n=1 Tax=Gorillibacterium sp. sgz5001074 TaxID=3446695 RepID=UPI003F66F4B3
MSESIRLEPLGLHRQDQMTVFNALMDDVLERQGRLQDSYEIAAILESMGWNDRRVRREFGFSDVFGLAEAMWIAVQDKLVHTDVPQTGNKGWLASAAELSRAFLRGVIFALPMAISVFSMLTLKFSLWSYENLSVELATSIAIGTILSFMTVGGFTQAIARRGFFYMIQGQYQLARRNTYLFIRVGFIVAIAVALLMLVLDLLFTLFPYRMLVYIVAYYVLLNSIWLTVTVMYILRREITFTALIMLGIAVVYVLYKILGMDIIYAQLLAISLVSVLGILLIGIFFRHDEKKMRLKPAPLPRMSIMIYSTMHYFFYGFLYFTFLYIDRVMAWSTSSVYMPYIIWFRGEYELGLDFALLMLVLPMGFCEVSVSWLMKDLEAGQKMFMGSRTGDMNKKYRRLYLRTQVMHVAVSVISAVMIYYAATVLDHYYDLANGKSFLASSVTRFVLFWALASYTVLSVFLMNAVILFALSQPVKMNKALLPGIIANFIIGFLLSRWVGYEYAIFGLLAGSLLAAVLSSIQVMSVIKRLDYYLYSAS